MKIFQKSLYTFTLLFAIALLFSCSEDVTDDFIADEPGTMTAKIDGVNFKSEGFFPISVNLEIDDDTDIFDLQIDGEQEKNGFEERITISIFGLDFTSLSSGDVFVGGADVLSGGKRMDGDYYKISRTEGDNTDFICDSEQIPASTAKVTKIDFTNRLISGTFSFKAIDISDSDNTFQITNGVFTDIEY